MKPWVPEARRGDRPAVNGGRLQALDASPITQGVVSQWGARGRILNGAQEAGAQWEKEGGHGCSPSEGQRLTSEGQRLTHGAQSSRRVQVHAERRPQAEAPMLPPC